MPLINSESKILRLVGYVVYVFLFLMILGIILPSEDTTTKTKATSTATKSSEKISTLTEDDVEDMIGKQKEINVFGGDVVIIRPDQDYWSLVLQESDAMKMFQKLFKDPRVSSVKITTHLKGVDAYGKESVASGTRFYMTNKTAAKIDWNNFLYSNLPEVADDSQINPVLFEED